MRRRQREHISKTADQKSDLRMSSRSDIQCNNITSSKGMKKKLQVKKQLKRMFEFENSTQSQTRNILELVKRNILMCHQNKVAVKETGIKLSPAMENRLQDTQRAPLTDQKNISYGKSRSEDFECSTVTKQLLRKSILEKQKEKMLRDNLQPKEKYINYKLWRPW